jgi:hypothetical protein
MAVELPGRPRDLTAVPSATAVAAVTATAKAPSHELLSYEAPRPWPKAVVRVLETVPGALALFLISTLIWGYVWFPAEIAVALLLFDVYWFWKSWTIAYHVLKGVRLIKRFKATNWRAAYARAAIYKESIEKLRQTLEAMASADGARESVIPVLAMEELEPGAEPKAIALAEEFADRFYHFLVTFHPGNLPGEVRGKSSNQAWAARKAVDEMTGRLGLDIDNMTVTSCDADTIFPRQYFECLTYHFAIEPRRYRRFWQAPIFFYNNIWQVPAPLRVPNALSGLIHLSRLTRKRRVLFSQSTYSLSMRMAHDVGYWDVDIIPEDWHMFLKCFYRLNGSVDVQPIHLPLGNDGALSHTTRATYVNQYLQVQRWAWGASDVPFAFQESIQRADIPLKKRLLRFWYFFENHLTWSTQWFFITLGGLIPWLYGEITGTKLIPEWFYIDTLAATTFLPDWLSFAPGWLTITTLILTPCLVFYVILITTDARLRPPPPVTFTRLRHAFGLLHWLAIPPITFFFSALPALDSQVRLMLGRRMEYRVTEKV